MWGHVGGPSPKSLIQGWGVGKQAWIALPPRGVEAGAEDRQAAGRQQQAGSNAARSEDFSVSCTLDRSMLLLSLIVSVTAADAGAVHVGVTVPVGVTAAMALAASVASAS